MVDLESVAVSSHPALFQIGAVQFSQGEDGKLVIGETFVSACTMQNAIKGDRMDSTIKFWEGLPEVLAEIEKLAGDRTQGHMFNEFRLWVNSLVGDDSETKVYIHGNGAAEDCVWLVNGMNDYGFTIRGHSFRTNLCFRTLKSMAKAKYAKKFLQAQTDIFSDIEVTTEHDALCDAIYQVKCLDTILQFLDLDLPE